jgi:hypothetical protein
MYPAGRCGNTEPATPCRTPATPARPVAAPIREDELLQRDRDSDPFERHLGLRCVACDG